jgi:hypothetical protein
MALIYVVTHLTTKATDARDTPTDTIVLLDHASVATDHLQNTTNVPSSFDSVCRIHCF